MYKYYNKDGEYVIGRKEGNKITVDSIAFTEYEIMCHDARYIRINEIRYIREDLLKTK